jgi:hypothetical protein
MSSASLDLIKAVAVTAELCGRTFSEPAARVFVEDLQSYPELAVLAALRRCRREVKGLLTVQDVVSRLEDGRPGPEEAWATVPKSEAETVVWTDEMAVALRVAQPLLDAGDRVGARMAFKEAYQQEVARARDAGRAVKWQISLGHDREGREAALLQAVEQGRVAFSQVRDFLPARTHPRVAALIEAAVRRIAETSKTSP